MKCALLAVSLAAGSAFAQEDPEARLHAYGAFLSDLPYKGFAPLAREELSRYARRYPEGRFLDDVHFRQGRSAHGEGDEHVAAARFLQVRIVDAGSLRDGAAEEELAAILRERSMKSLRDRYAEAIERYRVLPRPSSEAVRLAFLRALVLVDDDRLESLLRDELGSFMDLYPTAAELPELTIAIASFESRRGAHKSAIVEFDRVWHQWPESPLAARAAIDAGDLLAGPLREPLAAIERYRRVALEREDSPDAATAWLRKGETERKGLRRFDIAVRDFDEVVARYPHHPDAFAAMEAKAELLHEDLRDTDGAVQVLVAAAARSSEDPRAPEVLERAARLCEKQLKDRRRSAEYLEHVATRYPGFDRAAEDLYRAGELREDDGDLAYAESLYRQVATRFPGSDWARKAEKKAERLSRTPPAAR